MDFLNRKDANENYIISDNELIKLIKLLDDIHGISSTSVKSDFVFELYREDSEYVECVLARYMSHEAPIRKVVDCCSLNDFECFSPLITSNDARELNKDFRKFMYTKFGKEYLVALKMYLDNARDKEIEEQTKSITRKYEEEMLSENL